VQDRVVGGPAIDEAATLVSPAATARQIAHTTR
jgi:hypothetical protein